MDPTSTQPSAAEHIIRKITLIGMIVNLILSGLKIAAGFLGASQAVIADGFHSLSDCITDIIVIIGVKFWSMPPDTNHPYGHQRIETVVTIIVGLALAATAIALGYNAFTALSGPPSRPPDAIAFIAALLSIIAKETLYQYTIKSADKIRSSALKANAWHHRSDAFSSIPVAVAVVAIWIFPQFRFIDSIAAMAVSAFILHTAWKIVRPNLGQLTDEGAGEQIVSQIESVSKGIAGVEDVHAIRTRSVGTDIFVDLHVEVNRNLTVDQGHEIAGQVKHTLKRSDDSIRDVLVHIEPLPAEKKIAKGDGI